LGRDVPPFGLSRFGLAQCQLEIDDPHIVAGRKAVRDVGFSHGIVDERALYDALKSGKIAGAAFDVLKEEPLKEKRLLALRNFIVTPHISAFTREAIEKTEKLSAQNVVDVLKGHHCPYVMNPEALTLTASRCGETA